MKPKNKPANKSRHSKASDELDEGQKPGDRSKSELVGDLFCCVSDLGNQYLDLASFVGMADVVQALVGEFDDDEFLIGRARQMVFEVPDGFDKEKAIDFIGQVCGTLREGELARFHEFFKMIDSEVVRRMGRQMADTRLEEMKN